MQSTREMHPLNGDHSITEKREARLTIQSSWWDNEALGVLHPLIVVTSLTISPDAHRQATQLPSSTTDIAAPEGADVEVQTRMWAGEIRTTYDAV